MMVFGMLEDRALWRDYLKGRRKAEFSANMEIFLPGLHGGLQQLNVAGRNTMLTESCRDGVVVLFCLLHLGVMQRRA